MDLRSRWARGSCAGLNPRELDKVFFPGTGRPKKVPPYEQYCRTCPIVNFCLSYALIYGEEGVWGNTTEEQRKQLLKASPDLKDRLIQEAKNQGWYVPRKSVEELLEETVPEPLDELLLDEVPHLDLEIFQVDFALKEPRQTLSNTYTPPAIQSVEVVLLDVPTDLSWDSNEPLLILELPLLDMRLSSN